MFVRIVSVEATPAEPLVEFDCAVGRGRAVWKGSPHAPLVGHAYAVELDLRSCAPPVTDIQPSDQAVPELSVLRSRTRLVGLVEDVLPEEIAEVRVGTARLALELVRARDLVGRWVEIRTSALEAWDTAI